MFTPTEKHPNAVRVSRFDPANLLAAYSPHPFSLDGKEWKTVEHYYQATKFDGSFAERIAKQATPNDATKAGEGLYAKLFGGLEKDWKNKRQVMMTRAVYTQCRTHAEISDALLATGDETIIDSSAYDYFWGIGRDGRGENTYGQVLMNVRNKLREEANDSAA